MIVDHQQEPLFPVQLFRRLTLILLGAVVGRVTVVEGGRMNVEG